ncbi:hypothetical protein HPB50_023901 [Hyalomma asiaticum]|uniref:Uncharacterized protein n=1 Tax=Hyalomma asiaticum TaxID=266040 RepID=A0ACB7SZ85_HYAAI|nr:hypothetical protein HPB50_023901 [Hyalomma asiaticum]
MMLSWMEKIPDQVGFLVLNADGGVMSSGGELENEERIGEIIRKMVYCADRRDLLPTDNNDPINRMSNMHRDLGSVTHVTSRGRKSFSFCGAASAPLVAAPTPHLRENVDQFLLEGYCIVH